MPNSVFKWNWLISSCAIAFYVFYWNNTPPILKPTFTATGFSAVPLTRLKLRIFNTSIRSNFTEQFTYIFSSGYILFIIQHPVKAHYQNLFLTSLFQCLTELLKEHKILLYNIQNPWDSFEVFLNKLWQGVCVGGGDTHIIQNKQEEVNNLEWKI